jgi:hypothetical protein
MERREFITLLGGAARVAAGGAGAAASDARSMTSSARGEHPTGQLETNC